ncbi:MAG TPA: DoxX family protein [Steroidobacteraceae bacterium]|jgi:hypothetical protein|nr:DoxX family protein [Steroidobacteraceae bacterium]
MNASAQDVLAPSAKVDKLVWTGRVLSGLVVAFMLFDAIIKLIPIQAVYDTFRQMGIPEHLAFEIGLIGLTCTILYAIPRTAVLGAILLTAMYGGGIASHLRIGSPLFSHVLFGVYLGLFAWGGLFLRDARLRALIPLRK